MNLLQPVRLYVLKLKAELSARGLPEIKIGSGLNTGTCIVVTCLFSTIIVISGETSPNVTFSPVTFVISSVTYLQVYTSPALAEPIKPRDSNKSRSSFLIL